MDREPLDEFVVALGDVLALAHWFDVANAAGWARDPMRQAEFVERASEGRRAVARLRAMWRHSPAWAAGDREFDEQCAEAMATLDALIAKAVQ